MSAFATARRPAGLGLRSLALALVACAAALGAPATAAEPIDVGTRRELFVDRFLIDRMSGTELRLQKPVDEGPALKFDAPWEGAFCAYVTIIHSGGKYQAYYRGLAEARQNDEGQVTCYAESSDGIRWTKPELDLHPLPGHLKTNIVLADVPGKVTHNFSPFLDARPGVSADERYKAVGGYDDTGLFIYASPDGIRWKAMRDEPVLTKQNAFKSFLFDSQNVAFWSEAEGKYLLYYRIYKDKFRRIRRAESVDFIHWTNHQMMEYQRPDGKPVVMEQLYTNQTQPYFRSPGLYVATAARIMLGRQVVTTQQAEAIHVHPKYFQDVSDAVLLTSRGGNVYHREFMEALVTPGIGATNWVSRTNYPALNVVQTGPAEMSLYVNQNYGQPTSHLRRYSIRLDGLASVRADYDGGEMVTKPIVFQGSTLLLNFSTSAAGGIRVELQDAEGKPLPGFTAADCREVIGNEIEHPVEWNGSGDLSALAGKAVRLRFVMKDADLFAMRFGVGGGGEAKQ